MLNFIQSEHPQTIALIFCLSETAASRSGFLSPPQDKQAALRRIAKWIAPPEIIKEVERVLEKKLSSLVTEDYTATGGLQAIVDVLNSVDRGTEKFIMETLEIEDADLAEDIRKRMFVFEDILQLDNRAIQRFLREVDNNQLALALKGATEEVQNLIYNNMSKR